jgi:ethanolamine utilization microcompartment shell protein EutL
MSVGTDDIIDDAVTDAKISLDSVYTVWYESLGSESLSQILFKRNTISFDPSIIVAHSGTYGRPDVTTSGNNVYVVWKGTSLESRDIWFRRSTDGGASFGDIVNLRSKTTGSLFEQAIAASGNNVYVVWVDNITAGGVADILYRRSTDGGASFGDIVNLTENTGSDGEAPAIAASGNNVYVVWSDFSTGNGDILYKKSTNGGASFGDTKKLSNTPGSSNNSAIAVTGNNVYVVWRNITPGILDILYRRSTNGGANFGRTVNLSRNTGFSQLPAIAASGNNVYVVWLDDSLVPDTFDILYRRSTNGGANFGRTVNLSNTAGHSGRPAVAASGSNVYVVWDDDTATQAGVVQFDILYRRSTNGGANFGRTVNLSNTAGHSSNAAIVASNNLT